jgi:hypothetical protein
MNIFKLSCRQILVFSVFLTLHSQVLPAAESALPVFPDIPNDPTGKEPLVVQLAVSNDHVVRYKPVDFYVRMKNRGSETLEIELGYPDGITKNLAISTSWQEENKKSIYIDKYQCRIKAGGYKSSIILTQNQSIIIKIPRLFLNKSTDVSLEHRVFVEQNKKYAEKKTLSNSVHVDVEEKPLSKEEIEEIQKECRKMFTRVPISVKGFQRNPCVNEKSLMLFYSPYSLPVLKDVMEKSTSLTERFLAAKSLSMIAEQDPDSVKFNTDIITTFIDYIKTETNEEVKFDLICLSSVLDGFMTDAQKSKKHSILLELLEDKSEGIRYMAASCLCSKSLAPEEKQLIEGYLDKSHFLSQGFANQIRELLKRTNEQSIKKN